MEVESGEGRGETSLDDLVLQNLHLVLVLLDLVGEFGHLASEGDVSVDEVSLGDALELCHVQQGLAALLTQRHLASQLRVVALHPRHLLPQPQNVLTHLLHCSPVVLQVLHSIKSNQIKSNQIKSNYKFPLACVGGGGR